MAAEFTVQVSQVVANDDKEGGDRIKAKMPNETNIIEDIPWAFPLNPKMFHCIPQVGDAVLVLTTKPGDIFSQRYYIGPIISQMQNMSSRTDYLTQQPGATQEGVPIASGFQKQLSFLQSGILKPMPSIDNFAETKGAFPSKKDIALVGRTSEDIILKDGEIDLRCGIRKPSYDFDNGLTGNVLFNNEDPVRIQMRYKRGLTGASSANGVVNIAADKINLISYKQHDSKGSPSAHTNGHGTDTTGNNIQLVKDSDIDKLSENLHNCTYADVLIPILKSMCNAIRNHTHKLGNTPPVEGPEIDDLTEKEIDIYNISSPYVKIS